MSSELSTGKTIVILAVVIGCFAVLWPKVFYPMLTSSMKPISQDVPHPHTRSERPSHLKPDSIHPALREKGRSLPERTIEKQARPGPMPGIRPPMGGGGHMAPPQTKGSGAMGIVMPLYTVAIIIFFVYTLMKVLFKKNNEEDKTPKLKDYHMDPEYRKYVFAEEYLDNSNNSSHRDMHMRRLPRETSKQRNRSNGGYSDTKLEDEQMDQLRRRLEETETAMEKLMSQMGSVTDKLTAAKITEVLSQAQSQAKFLKDYEDGITSDVQTLSEDFFLSKTLEEKLDQINLKDMYIKGTFVSCDESVAQTLDNEIIMISNNEPYSEEQKNVQELSEINNDITAPKDMANVTSKPNECSFDKIIKDATTEMNEQNSNMKKVEQTEQKVEQKIEQKIEQKVEEKVEEKIEQKVEQKLELKVEQKDEQQLEQVEAIEGLSDIALLDTAEYDEDLSEALETGADISELKSYADDGVVSSHSPVVMPVIEEFVPEVTFAAAKKVNLNSNDTGNIEKPEIPVVRYPETKKDAYIYPEKETIVTKTEENIFPFLRPVSPSVDQGTQTEAVKKMSVLDLQTTYMLKDQIVKEQRDKDGSMENINEIILDATVPSDTQLLVKEAVFDSIHSERLAEISNESENLPCVITSQVNLAFVGLEKSDTYGNVTTIVIPERCKTPDKKQNIQTKNLAKSSQICQIEPKLGKDHETTVSDSKLKTIQDKVDEIILRTTNEVFHMMPNTSSKDSTKNISEIIRISGDPLFKSSISADDEMSTENEQRNVNSDLHDEHPKEVDNSVDSSLKKSVVNKIESLQTEGTSEKSS